MKTAERHINSSSIAFVCIHDLKSCDSDILLKATSQLHLLARSCNKRQRKKATILSTLTGLILIVSDASSNIFFSFLNELAAKCNNLGLPIRIGITHGDVEALADIDEVINYIGTPLNYAARLAFSEKNNGCLIEQSYRDFSDSQFGNKAGHIFSVKPIKIKGKAHDKAKFTCYKPNAGQMPTIRSIHLQNIVSKRATIKEVAGLIIAYDLPKFSAGDRSQLSQRFRSVIDTFALLKNNLSMPDSKLYFLPGGDGGIVVLTNVKTMAFELASKFAELLGVESKGKSENINVVARIGVHYGSVWLYKNAENITRPTGRACFIADEIASDAVAKQNGGIIFSKSLIDTLSSGSGEHFSDKFELLPPRTEGVAKDIARFVLRKQIRSRNSILVRLTSPRGRWERT